MQARETFIQERIIFQTSKNSFMCLQLKNFTSVYISQLTPGSYSFQLLNVFVQLLGGHLSRAKHRGTEVTLDGWSPCLSEAHNLLENSLVASLWTCDSPHPQAWQDPFPITLRHLPHTRQPTFLLLILRAMANRVTWTLLPPVGDSRSTCIEIWGSSSDCCMIWRKNYTSHPALFSPL